eukprot:gene19405-66395_t
MLRSSDLRGDFQRVVQAFPRIRMLTLCGNSGPHFLGDWGIYHSLLGDIFAGTRLYDFGMWYIAVWGDDHVYLQLHPAYGEDPRVMSTEDAGRICADVNVDLAWGCPHSAARLQELRLLLLVARDDVVNLLDDAPAEVDEGAVEEQHGAGAPTGASPRASPRACPQGPDQ